MDPVDDPATALHLLMHAASHPLAPETIAVLLDRQRTGSSIVVISGTTLPGQVIEVAECLLTAAAEVAVASLLLASVRPDGGLLPDDADRWLEMSDVAASFGIDLLEWFVIGTRTECPRDLLGEAPRWGTCGPAP